MSPKIHWSVKQTKPRKVLQINNTCDLVAGGDKIYMSSRNRNQFFQLREMRLGC